MINVKINEETRQYPKGTTLEAIAKEYQNNFDAPIFIAIENGQCVEICSQHITYLVGSRN